MDYRSYVNSLAPTQGSGGGGDFWRPTESGKYFVRFYRFRNSENEDEKELFAPRIVHFGGKGVAPEDCTGPGCMKCKQSDVLRAAKDKASRASGWSMRANQNAQFSLVRIEEPTGFVIWEASESNVRKVFLAMAKTQGWSGPYPEEPKKDENGKYLSDEDAANFTAQMSEFFAAFNAALDQVCGPNGWNFCITYNKETKDKKNTWDIDFVMKTPKTEVLAIPEDGEVPNPFEIRKRIAEKSAKG